MNWPVVGATVFPFAEIAPLTAKIYLSANPRFQSRYSSTEISPESRLARIAGRGIGHWPHEDGPGEAEGPWEEEHAGT